MIEKIKIGLNNLYLFKNKNDEYLLLDTGINVKNKEILKKLIQKIGDIKKIKVIVLSHSHSDHVGNLKMLIDEIGDVKVIAHRNSENVLETGKSVIPNGFYWFTEKISKKLENIALDLYTNRGINIVEGHQIADIKKKMKEMKKDLYPPFTLVIDRIETVSYTHLTLPTSDLV